MTPQPPEPPPRQVNTHGGTGFQDGYHVHNYGGGYPAGAAALASRQATTQGIHRGPPITEWDPADLGVHQSITVDDETGLTPYLARAHDRLLRDQLTQAKTINRPTFVLVVGTSCAGKTRTLYEAVLTVLPKWTLTAPQTDSDLARVLLDGIPATTVVWLDELQDRLPATTQGITAAKAIIELLTADQLGPIVFAGTIWPTNLTALQNRPDPAAAAGGAGVIPDLLENAVIVNVPDVFTDDDLKTTAAAADARLRKVIDTATHTDHPEHGRKITQVLAGGTQLLNRLYPPAGIHRHEPFTPIARAVLRAAGDLRRIGMPNPLPRWAIEGAAPGYLDPPDHRPPEQWFPIALEQATRAARHDDPVTGTRTHDIHHHGIPALTPHWTTTPDRGTVEAYDLHDYLHQDHLTRHRQTPTRPSLWDTLTTYTYSLPGTPYELADAASRRGLLTHAITLLRSPADAGYLEAPSRLAGLLALRCDPTAVTELRHRADAGDRFARQRLFELLVSRADPDSLAELRARADAGDQSAREKLFHLLVSREDPGAVAELRARADAGDRFARQRLFELLVSRADPDSLAELRARADAGDGFARERLFDLLVSREDPDAVAELRARADYVCVGDIEDDGFCEQDPPDPEPLVDESARERLAELLVRRGDPDALAELRARADAHDESAQPRLAELLVRRGDPDALAELRARADAGDRFAQPRLADLLVRRGDPDALAELRARADAGDRFARQRLFELLVRRGDPDALAELRARADAHDESAQPRLAELLVRRGDPDALAELRARADAGDRFAQPRLADLLVRRGDPDTMAELCARAAAGDRLVQERLFNLLARRGDPDSFTQLKATIHGGFGGYSLLQLYRAREPNRRIRELDCRADPVYDD